MTITDLRTGALSGDRVTNAIKTVADLANYWGDPAATVDPEQVLYTTETFWAAPDNTPGAVLWGNTTLMPGDVGGEFFMTRGHRHVNLSRGELMIGVSGQGLLVLMDEDRRTWTEEVVPGATIWIDGRLAHRTVNTGDEPLVFLCAWPADCGHNFDEIERLGFGTRIMRFDKP